MSPNRAWGGILGLMANPATEARRVQVARMRRAGHSVAEIAVECSVSQGTVSRDLAALRRQGYDLGMEDHRLLIAGRREAGNEGERLANQQRVLELTVQGLNQSAVARQLGLHKNTVATYLANAIAEVRNPLVDQIREVSGQRLDMALRKCVELLDHIDPHVRLKAVQRLVSVEAERARLFGTYVPIRVDATITEVTQQDIELQQMIDEARAQAAAQEQQLREQAGDAHP